MCGGAFFFLDERSPMKSGAPMRASIANRERAKRKRRGEGEEAKGK